MSLPLSQVLQQIAGRRVLVVGDVIADEYLVGESSRLSSEAPVPVLRYTGETRRSVARATLPPTSRASAVRRRSSDWVTMRPARTSHGAVLTDAVAARLAACDIVVVSDYAKGLLTNGVCREVQRRAKAAGKPVVVDPRPQHASFYSECDYLTPNWRESLAMLHEGDADDSAMTPRMCDGWATL